jgi:two-component system chemotaxis sensor kinase CheA
MSENQKSTSPDQWDESIGVIDFEAVEQVSRAFFSESHEILEGLDQLILSIEQNPDDIDRINVLFRKVHTLKGSVGAVPGGQLLGSLAHEFEALLTRIKRDNQSVTKECVDIFLHSSRLLKVLAKRLSEKEELFPEELSEVIELITRYGSFEFSGVPATAKKATSLKAVQGEAPAANEGVWLSLQQFNELRRMSGEVLVLKNFHQMMNQTVNFRNEPDLFERRQSDFAQNLAKLSEQFQGLVQEVRQETAAESFEGLQVLVRQASTELNKSVQLECIGMDLWIDKTMGRDLYSAMVHLVRNSIDHGIEDQFERTVAGKPSTGQLTFEVSEKNSVVHLYFKDDGHGLDRERILARAMSSGLVTEAEGAALPDSEIYKFIFNAGFSTKDKITTISGRGVGMDVVQSTVDKYGGEIQIETEKGQGTTFKLLVPVPQNIMVESALLCRWGDFQLAVPLNFVAHITSCHELVMTTVEHLRYCQYKGLTVPIMNYREMNQLKVEDSIEKVKAQSAVFIRSKNRILALLVDEVQGQSDLVIKPFGKITGAMKGFKGVSILADEKVTYVMDAEEVLSVIRYPDDIAGEAA